MKDVVKQILVALAAATAAAIGTSLGAVAAEEIKKRYATPVPVPPTKRKKKSRA